MQVKPLTIRKLVFGGVLMLAVLLPFYKFNNLNTVYLSYDRFDPHLYLTTWFPENFGSFNYLFYPFDMLTYVGYQIFPQRLASIFPLILIQLLAYISFFKLANYIFHSTRIAMFSALFYIYSVYAQFISGWPIHSGTLIYALLPLFIYRVIKLTRSNYKVELSHLTLMFFFLTGVNLTYIVYLFLVLLIVSGLKVILDFSWKGVRFAVFTYLVLCGLFVLSSAVYFLTYGSQTIMDKTFLEDSLAGETIDWKSSGSKISEVVREMGSVNYTYNYKDIYSYPNARVFFENKTFLVLTYFPSLAFVFALLLRPKTLAEEKVKLVCVYSFIGIFFMALGANQSSPTEPLFRFLTEYIPYFKVFRDSFKATVVIHLVYVLAIAYIPYRLESQLAKTGYVIVSLLILLVLSSTYWSGHFFEYETVNIPKYWQTLSDDYKSQYGGSRIIFTPRMNFPAYVFITKKIGSTTFYRPLFDFNMINPNSVHRYNDVMKQIYQNLDPGLLGLYNTRLLLNQFDIHWSLYKSMDPIYLDSLIRSRSFDLIRSYD